MQLLQNEFLSIAYDPATRIVRFSRTKNRYPLNEQTKEVMQKIHDVFEQVGRETSALLVDMREAPLRNDEEFEKFNTSPQTRLFSGFARTAFLVKTAVGELQFARLRREGRVSAFVFDVFRDEAEALAYLREERSSFTK
jgi:hypothetical protein